MKYDISSHIVTVYHCHGIFFKLHTSIASLLSSAMRNRCTRNYFKYLKVFATFLHYSTIVYQGDPWLFLCQAVQVPTEALWFIPMWSSLWIGLGNARCPMGMYQAAKATFPKFSNLEESCLFTFIIHFHLHSVFKIYKTKPGNTFAWIARHARTNFCKVFLGSSFRTI